MWVEDTTIFDGICCRFTIMIPSIFVQMYWKIGIKLRQKFNEVFDGYHTDSYYQGFGGIAVLNCREYYGGGGRFDW